MAIRLRHALIIMVLAGAALAVSLYIMNEVSEHKSLPGCGAGGCGDVLSSHWEQWGPIPVSLLGVGGYLALIMGCIVLTVPHFRPVYKVVWSLMSIEAWVGLGFIVWLVALQGLVIGHYCMFCLSSHLFGVLAYGVVLAASPIRSWSWVGGGAASLLGAMIAIHILIVPHMSVVQAAEDVLTNRSAAELQTGSRIQFGKPMKPSRTVQLLEGALTFDLYSVPVDGDRTAEHVMLTLSDYKCPSCRKLHRKLKQYIEEQGVSLAIVCLPVPLNADINPNVSHTPAGFENSGIYANYSMAVQKADPEKFSEYHDFLMSGGWAPTVEEARIRAEELVGTSEFAAALLAPEVKEWITTGINAHQYIQAKTLPRLISKDKVISYSGGSKAAFRKMIDSALGIEEDP